MKLSLTLDQLLPYSLYLVLFILPFQTRYLLIESANPFATVSVYAFDLVIVLVGLLWLWNWYHQPQIKVNWTSITLGLSLLVVAGGASYFAADKIVALYYWLHLALGLWLMAIIATSKLNQQAVLVVVVFNGLVQTIVAITQFMTQHVIANKWLGVATQLPELSGTSVVVTTAGRWLRSYALLPHPNITGGVIVLSLIAAAYLARQLSKHGWWLAIIGGTLSFGLCLTFSRGAIIAWCVVLGFMTLMRVVRPSFVLASIGTILVTALIYWPLVSSRIWTEQYTEQLSLVERQDQLQQFTEVFKTRWPFGLGLGQYTLTAPQPIHNVPLMLLAELGILGSILWFSLILQPLLALRQSAREHPASYLILGILLLGMIDHYFWTLPSFFLLWCALTRYSRIR